MDYKYEVYGYYFNEDYDGYGDLNPKIPDVSHVDILALKDIGNGVEEMVKIATSDVVNCDGYCGVFDFANFEVDEQIDLSRAYGLVKNNNNEDLAHVEIDFIEEVE